jgi:hypothetical protein
MKAARVDRNEELRFPVQPLPRKPRRTRTKSRTSPNQALAVENLTKIGVNLLLATVAIVTLFQQIPRQKQQEIKLQEIQTEVSKSQVRVDKLNDDLSRYFDPATGAEVMQEQTHLVLPNQRDIVIPKTSKKQ